MALCYLITPSVESRAQTPAAKDYSYAVKETSSIRKNSKTRKSTPLGEQERITAISILTSLADESERYKDPTLRARTQARVADALWDADETLARGLFLRAWKTAEEVDAAGEHNAEEARKKALSNRGGGITILLPTPNLRSEVLSLVVRRDSALGGVFIARLDESTDQESSAADEKNSAQSFFDPTEPKLAITKRLEVALRLLDAGDVKQAKEFAAPALEYATSQGIIFLCALRQKDALNADELYASLLTRAASDPRSDATAVSLLSSYIFTPNLLVTATQRGRVSNQFDDKVGSRDFSPTLRANFFGIAAQILLRRISLPDLDRTAAGRAGTYFTIARLLPLFEQYAGDYVPALNAQLNLLAPDAPESFRNGEEGMLKAGLVPSTSDLDVLPDILKHLADVTSSTDRDATYVKAIRAGAINGDGRILQFAEKIDNLSLKERARSFAALAAVRSAINKKDADGALRVVNDGYLAPLHRAWALTEVARLLKKSDPERALQAINDAVVEANRISVGEPDRVYALVCVALPLFDLDRGRWWDAVSDVIKAANAVPGFSGEEGKLYGLLRTRDVIAIINSDEPSFNMMKLFDFLAGDDLQLAVSMANNLAGEAARSGANLAIARSVLNRQKRPPSTLRK